MFKARVLFLASILLLQACQGIKNNAALQSEPGAAKGESTAAACSAASSDSWCQEYTRRSDELQNFLNQNFDDYKSFASASLGHGGFPYILLRLAPELFPELIAAQGQDFSRLGFSADYLNPETGLPLGLNNNSQQFALIGFAINSPIQVSTLTCGGCHIGQVEGPDGKRLHLIGAGNSHFDSSGLFKLFEDVVRHKNFDWKLVKKAIESKPEGFFYGADKLAQERIERALYTGFGGPLLLTGIKKAVLETRPRQDRFINQTAYVPNNALDYFARTPGRADAVGLTLARYADERNLDKMPKTPTITKIMSVWSQKDRTISHWTGDMPGGVNPVVAAEVAVIGDVKLLNKENIERSTRFINDLPPPPYPFAVDSEKAAAGRALFEAHCASCHVGDNKVYPVSELGTDSARIGATSDMTYEGFNEALHQGCPDDRMVCAPDMEPILRPRDWAKGYVATPLDGIWARSPYLHNGSVPTLYHLLVPSARPKNFVVGSMKFDTVNVGFEWREAMENTEIYRADRLGQYNSGHDTPAYLGGIDWANDGQKRDALIEFMKTL